MSDADWLKKSVDKIENKLDCLDQKIDGVVVVQTAQASDLSHHIYRTELAEENIALLREEIKPLKSHVAIMHGAFKIIGLASSIIGIIAGVMKIASFLL